MKLKVRRKNQNLIRRSHSKRALAALQDCASIIKGPTLVRYLLLLTLLIPMKVYTQDVNINVKEMGAKGNGVDLDTKVIQLAVDKCSLTGGTVFFPAGKYLTGTVFLKSNVSLYLAQGSVILGSAALADYPAVQPKLKSYNDVFLKYSLFYAEEAEGISIIGEGTIDGQGSKFPVISTKKPERYKDRPFVIRFVQCQNIRIDGITLKNSPMWMQQYLACENLTIRNIRVFNHSNKNNDMMDIDGCKNVIVSGCIGDTDDDGITLKSTSIYKNENVSITNCILSSHCNAIKFGTESTGGFKKINISNIVIKPSEADSVITGFANGISGITLATVDGGIIDGVIISGVIIDGPKVPIFLRLGNRGRKHSDEAGKPPVGIFRNVHLSDITAYNSGTIGCSIMGLPNFPIEQVSLTNSRFNFPGLAAMETKDTKDFHEIPELEDGYPESTAWGNLPAFGVNIRHAEDINISGISFITESQDVRPAVFCSDVKNVVINNLQTKISPKAECVLLFNSVSNAYIRDSQSFSPGRCFLRVDGADSKNIKMTGNSFYNMVVDVICSSPNEIFRDGNFK